MSTQHVQYVLLYLVESVVQILYTVVCKHLYMYIIMRLQQRTNQVLAQVADLWL